MTRERGQVVLVAAAIVAVALVAMLLAAVQLGHPSTTSDVDGGDLPNAERQLETAVRRGEDDTAGRFPWEQRGEAARVVAGHLRPTVAAIERGGVATDVTHRIERNDTAASAIAREYCPRGEDRRYGGCAAHGAFVFQERAGEAHLLGVVVDVRVTGSDRTARATLFVRPRSHSASVATPRP